MARPRSTMPARIPNKDASASTSALRVFWAMHTAGVKLKRSALFRILSAAATLGALAEGKLLHRLYIVNTRFDSDTPLKTALLDMYGKCGSLVEARAVFDTLPAHDLISYTAMIGACAHSGHPHLALELFQLMESENVTPNKITFLNVLRACSNIASIDACKLAHERIVALGFDSETSVKNALVHTYAKCGSLKDARTVFDSINRRDTVSWTSMIAAYASNGLERDALKLFRRMEEEEGVKPTKVMFLAILHACGSLQSLDDCRAIHECIRPFVLSDVTLNAAIVRMYDKCGSLEDARTVFDGMRERNVIAWTVMIAAYVHNGKPEYAVKLFERMEPEGFKPSRITFLVVLEAYASLMSIEHGKSVHRRIVKCGFGSDIAVNNALINMYSKCGSLKDAYSVFDCMYHRDVISWSSMIATCAKNGQCNGAFELFQCMLKEGVKPDKITFLSVVDACASLASLKHGALFHTHIVACEFEYDIAVQNALVNMYAKCSSLRDAISIFGKMHRRDVVSFTAMIAGYIASGHSKEGLELFLQMGREDVKPNQITYLSILDACASQTSLELGKVIHEHISNSVYKSDVAVQTALLNMYAKCGNLTDAHGIFDGTHRRDLVSWNAMFAGYAQNGYGKEALELYRRMCLDGAKPNDITFLNILNACSHAGLLDDGLDVLKVMIGMHCITPSAEHYACMIDLLCRVGCLVEAEDLINNMPFQTDSVTWTIMLGASRTHGNVALGAVAAGILVELDPENASPYILLSNIYAAAGRWEDAFRVRQALEERVLKKRSRFEVDNEACIFLSGDTSHHQWE